MGPPAGGLPSAAHSLPTQHVKRPPVSKKPLIETVSDDDLCSEDVLEEGRDEIEILSSINAINICHSQWVPSTDVIADPEDVMVKSISSQHQRERERPRR